MPGCALLALVLTASLVSPAEGQAAAPEPVCTGGNLLASRRPLASFGLRGDALLATDGVVASEGGLWDAPLALVLTSSVSTLTYDLGPLSIVSAVYVQADANDDYRVWGSADGNDFRLLGVIEARHSHGLRGRTLTLTGVAIRYLRFGEPKGDGLYSVSEIAAFCRPPSPFPPTMTVVDTPRAPRPGLAWNDGTSARVQLVLALLGLAWLWWDRRLRRSARPERFARLRGATLAGLGLAALFAYFNFGSFHFPRYVHGWDAFHYYVGGKYFRELGYERLYECVAVADHERPELRARVERRKLTNLRTNRIETTADILAHPERCRQHFTEERWQSFQHDLTFFRELQGASRWDEAQTDHGFNGTPVWTALGAALANLAPASRRQIAVLTSLDPAYFAGMCALVWWAFGWRVLCVALLVLATNYPSRFYWTGGSFLRWDWLFYTTAGVCLLKKDKPFLAGVSLAYAALLRVFPALLLVGPLLAVAGALVRRRRPDPRYLRLGLGVALGGALLVAASLPLVGGLQAYRDFARNTLKHASTPLTNNMGLRTVVSYRPSEVGRFLRSDSLIDPWESWKEARLRAFKEARPAFVLICTAFLLPLARAVRDAEPWVAGAVGTTFIAFGAELTCYYYSFVVVVALLHSRSERVGIWLLLLTAFTQFVAWAPLLGMPTWLDEQYTLMSMGTLIAFAAVALERCARQSQGPTVSSILQQLSVKSPAT
jgi:hypothetical protein